MLSRADSVNNDTDKRKNEECDAAAFEREKTVFMRSVSHNLRSPLAAVLSCLRVLASGAVTDFEDVKKLVGGALTRAEDMIAIVDDMLALLEIQTEGVAGDTETDAVKSVSAVAGMFLRKAAEKNIGINIEAKETLHAISMSGKIFELLMKNLIDNAVKYSDPGTAVNIDITGTEGVVVIRITNSGLIVSAEDMDKIYIEYWRGRNAKEYADHGTGLGLAIVKKIIERCGGRIDVASDAKSGTTFTVAVPAK